MMTALVCLHVVGQLELGDVSGFRTPESTVLDVRRRVLDVRAPQLANQPFTFRDSARVDGALQVSVLGAAAISGALDAGVLTFASALATRDLVVTTTPSALELRANSTRLELELTLDPRAVALMTPDALEIWFQSRPVFRLSSPTDLRWNGSTLVVESVLAPVSVRIEVALMRVIVDGLPRETTAVGTWGASMVWHPDRQQLIRVGGIASQGTWAWSFDGGWVDLQLPSPPGRVRGAMVWDDARHSLVLFGGSGEVNLLDDTWEFIDGGWLERSTPTHPLARWSHGLAWDPLRKRAVLFGGLDGPSVGGREFDDTWEFDGTSWTQSLPPFHPTPRDAHGLAFDESRGEVVLFGGWPSSNDTWTWNGTRWRQLALANPPPVRASMGFAWDPLRRRLVTTGGWAPRGPASSPMRFMSDTWALDATGWSRLPDAPADWYRMAITGHPSLGIVAFGGGNEQGTLNETLALSNAWYSVDAPASRGPLVHDGLFWLAFSGDSVWTPRLAGWGRVKRLRFLSPSHVVWRNGPLALVPFDGGSQAWLDQGSQWAAVAAFPRASTMVSERTTNSLWLELEGTGTVVEWPSDAGPQPARPLPSPNLHLAAAGLTNLLLVGTDVTRWNPATGEATFIAPLPFPDAGGFTLLSDSRREVLVASNGQATLEWAGTAWREVEGRLQRTEWTNEYAGDLFGWGASGAFAQYEPLREVGARCTTGLQCRSSFCADGVCCQSACLEVTDCLACSIDAGGVVDGECRPIRSEVMKVCGGSEQDCVPRRCMGTAVCPAAVAECADAGFVLEPPRDAGGRALPLAPGPLPRAPGCGCDAAPLSTLALLAVGAARVRRRRAEAGHAPGA